MHAALTYMRHSDRQAPQTLTLGNTEKESTKCECRREQQQTLSPCWLFGVKKRFVAAQSFLYAPLEFSLQDTVKQHWSVTYAVEAAIARALLIPLTLLTLMSEHAPMKIPDARSVLTFALLFSHNCHTHTSRKAQRWHIYLYKRSDCHKRVISWPFLFCAFFTFRKSPAPTLF